MREYKFRGKEIDTGKWVYGYYFKDFNGKSYIINTLQEIENADISNVWIEVLEETEGQYTGLKDKNGKEIYEGDIVSFNLKSDSEGQPNITGYIEYQTTFSGYRIMSFKGSFALDYNIKDIEVIGNIYDNPNLLEEGE